ncbi:MAG: VWA domain-containing protein, partial [Pyrinomonadaceae bacterium]
RATPPSSSQPIPSKSQVQPKRKARPPIEDNAEDDVLMVSSNLVPLLVSVTGKDGSAIRDLRLEDFELRVDGQVKKISELSRAETPVRLLLLFDNSSSLSIARDMEKRAAIEFFRHVMRPGIDKAAILSIGSRPLLEQAWTDNLAALEQTIKGFGKPEGATALLDTIAYAADYLKNENGRRVIIIVSDGADTISRTNFETALKRIQASSCQVYSIQTGQSDNLNLHDLVADRRSKELAAQTGGAVYAPVTSSDLNAAYTRIAAELAEQYVLSYYPEESPVSAGRFHQITLRVQSRTEAQVRTRKGYFEL